MVGAANEARITVHLDAGGQAVLLDQVSHGVNHRRHLKIVARARNRQHAFRLMDLSLADDNVVRETLYSSLEMTRRVLVELGFDATLAADRVETFRRHDASVLKAQYLVYDDEAALVQSSKDALSDLERLFEADRSHETHVSR